jgi:threonine/homoserine/homoserine lactone efflux protein
MEDFESKRERQAARFQAILHFTMGILIFGAGVAFLLAEKYQYSMFGIEPNDTKMKILGVLFLLYGAWRLYRGYKLTRVR